MRILTFDIEDWFHLLDHESTKTVKEWSGFESRIHENVDRILELLNRKSQKSTCFCLGWIAEKYPEVIKKIHREGHEIGSHSYMHQLIFEQNTKEFKNDVADSIHLLEDLVGTKVESFRAPGFSLNSEVLWVFEILAELGIKYDSSIFPAKRSHGGITGFGDATPYRIDLNGGSIKEFPVNVKNLMGKDTVFSGGGYFRFFPYTYIKKWSRQSDYVMTYFHPRDFDASQPMIKDLSVFRKFKCYYGLGHSFQKFEKYLSDFEFKTLGMADREVDWGNAPRVNLDPLDAFNTGITSPVTSRSI